MSKLATAKWQLGGIRVTTKTKQVASFYFNILCGPWADTALGPERQHRVCCPHGLREGTDKQTSHEKTLV